MDHIFGDEIFKSIENSGVNAAIFEGGETENDPIILRCNDKTELYEAADMIHLYIEHWAKINSYEIREFDENRLMPADPSGRIYDNVFYNFYKDKNDTFGIDGVLFIFDVTEPLTKADPFDLSWLDEMEKDLKG